MLTAITWTVANPTSNPLQPKLVNQSINALSKPGYLRCVLGRFFFVFSSSSFFFLFLVLFGFSEFAFLTLDCLF